MIIHLPVPNDPVLAAIGVVTAAATLFALTRALRAGKPQPRVAKFSKPFVVLVVILFLAFFAGALAAWREFQTRPDQDPAAVTVMAIGAVFFLWGVVEALTRRLEWDAEGFRLSGATGPAVKARWEDVERVSLGRNQVRVDLKGPKPRRVAMSSFLVGLQAFVDEAGVARRG